MPKLDEIRKKLAVEPERTPAETAKGLLVADIAESDQVDFGVTRIQANACPSCGAADMQEIGVRHSGIHVRCSPCGFEFTRKTETSAKHEALVATAAIKHSKVISDRKYREEMRKLAKQQRMGKWTLEVMPDRTEDAILHFGRHAGKRISELSEDKEGRSYLHWLAMPSNQFDEELVDIVKVYIER